MSFRKYIDREKTVVYNKLRNVFCWKENKMGKFFGNKNGNVQFSQRALLEGRYNGARHNLILVVVLSVINLVMLLLNSDTYFLFSAYLPLLSVGIGMELCGKYPKEYYEEYYSEYETLEFFGNEVFIASIVIAVLIIALYLVCWIMAKNQKSVWLIIALALFSVDTVVMLLWNGISSDMIVDIVIHALVIYYLIMGIVVAGKIKKLPPEEAMTIEGEFSVETEEKVKELPEDDVEGKEE